MSPSALRVKAEAERLYEMRVMTAQRVEEESRQRKDEDKEFEKAEEWARSAALVSRGNAL